MFTSSTTSYIVAVETEYKGTGCFANNEAIFVLIRKWLKFQIGNKKRLMETSAAPVCHLVLMWIRSDMFSSLVIISWDNFLIKEWSIFERAILQKNSVKNAVHIIPSFVIHDCSFVILDIAEFWGGFETAITLTMQRKENLIQCEDMVFISLAAASIAAPALAFFAVAMGWTNLANEIEPAFD